MVHRHNFMLSLVAVAVTAVAVAGATAGASGTRPQPLGGWASAVQLDCMPGDRIMLMTAEIEDRSPARAVSLTAAIRDFLSRFPEWAPADFSHSARQDDARRFDAVVHGRLLASLVVVNHGGRWIVSSMTACQPAPGGRA